MPKGQVQAISMVLIAGIVISLAGAAYFWGKPMIEKRATLADIDSAEAFIIQLDKNIVEVARNGGSKSMSVPRISGSSITVEEDTEDLLYRFFTTHAMIDIGESAEPIPVDTFEQNDPGEYGKSPRVITLSGERQNDQYIMTLRLHYRELLDDTYPPAGYRISLNDAGKSGNNQISVSYSGTNSVPGGAQNEGELKLTNIDIVVS